MLVASAAAQSGAGTASAGAVSTPAAARTQATASFGSDGALLTNRDGSTQVRVNGYIQGDGRFFFDDPANNSPDRLLWRRIRPNFEGTLFGVLEFRFMPDFGQNNPQVQNAYVELRYPRAARVRVGKFKTPIGLEALRADQDATFVERSLASDLVPLRELGAQVGGSVLSNSVTYAAGFFDATTDGSNGNFQWEPRKEAVLRVFLQPFQATGLGSARGLGFGLAGSVAQEHGALPRFKTVGQNTFFKYASSAAADGQHTRVTPQAYYYLGPLGLLAEYTASDQEVLKGKQKTRVSNSAWQLSGSYMLTGEKNSYGTIRPLQGFEPRKGWGHLGGWEIAARYSQLRIGSTAFPLLADPTKNADRAREWSAGINWYVNRYVKIITDYEHTSFRMPGPTATPVHDENLILSRIQLAF